MHSQSLSWRLVKDKLFQASVFGIFFLALLPLFFILFYIVKNGISTINLPFLIQIPKPPGEFGGGIANAIVGTLLLIGLSSFISIPIAVITGIYLAEFASHKFTYWVRLCTEILQGIPSIVLGIVAYAWIVVKAGSFSLISGAVALSFIMIPVIARATEETLRLIPFSLKEASFALGVSYGRTLFKVVLPAGISGILTGILLGVARIAGETAPLLFTAFGNPFMSLNPLKPVSTLPLLIFNYATSPYSDWQAMAWGASLILLVLVLSLNLSSRIAARKWKVQF